MQDLISDLLVAVVTVCVPIFTAYIVKEVQKAGDNAAATAATIVQTAIGQMNAEAIKADPARKEEKLE